MASVKQVTGVSRNHKKRDLARRERDELTALRNTAIEPGKYSIWNKKHWEEKQKEVRLKALEHRHPEMCPGYTPEKVRYGAMAGVIAGLQARIDRNYDALERMAGVEPGYDAPVSDTGGQSGVRGAVSAEAPVRRVLSQETEDEAAKRRLEAKFGKK